MIMRRSDRQGRVRERSLVVSALQESGDRGDRVLVRFTGPGDIKGTGLLVWEYPAADDERALYLPALGRVQRIVGSEKQESFVGSEWWPTCSTATKSKSTRSCMLVAVVDRSFARNPNETDARGLQSSR
jgi:Outer membrane lipoprotein-sorting protein